MSVATNLYAVKSVIRIIRDQRVILDSDLAKLYGVPAKRLNEAVKRNSKRFPADFMFQLDAQENAGLRSHLATLINQQPANQGVTSNWSQIATSSSKHRGTTYLPYAFTEHGIIMAASVLNSDRAIEMSVFIARTFVRMREQLMANAAYAKRLAEIEKMLLTPSKNCLISSLPYYRLRFRHSSNGFRYASTSLISTSAFRVRRSALSVPPSRTRLRRTGQTLNSQRLTLNSQFNNARSSSHA